MLPNYPIVHEFIRKHSPNHGSSVGMPALPYLGTGKSQISQPLQSDHYLVKVVSIVRKWFTSTDHKVPFSYAEGRMEIIVTISLPIFPFYPSNHPALSGKHTEPPPTPNISKLDALIFLITALLYSNGLIEMIQQSSLCETVERWRKLKVILIEFSKMLDNVLNIYKDQAYSCCSLPKIGDLEELQKKIHKLLRKSSVDSIKEVFGQQLKFSSNELVTTALGLNRNVATTLSEIRSGPCNHQTDLYHFKDILCKAVKENCTRYDPEAKIFDILVASGFSDAKAQLLDDQLKSNELFSHQPLSYWVESYLDFMFQYDIFLTTQYARFPHQEDMLDEWFNVPTTRTTYNECTDEEDEVTYDIEVYNTIKGLHSITRNEACYPPRNIEGGIWYHATDHDSAENIRVNGIQLTDGCCNQDFSDGDGFYLTPCLASAQKWAESKQWLSRAAIIIFRHNIDGEKYNGLDLSLDSEEKWSQVIRYYRSGRDSRLFKCPKKLSREFDGKDYIKGSMSTDARRCEDPEWRPVKSDEPKLLCIKSQELADEFSANIDGIIYLSRHDDHI